MTETPPSNIPQASLPTEVEQLTARVSAVEEALREHIAAVSITISTLSSRVGASAEAVSPSGSSAPLDEPVSTADAPVGLDEPDSTPDAPDESETAVSVPAKKSSRRSEGDNNSVVSSSQAVVAPTGGTPVKSEGSKDPTDALAQQEADGAEEEAAREQTFALKTSCWDTIILLFMPGSHVKTINSIVATVLFLTNAAVQIIFTILIITQAAELKSNTVGEQVRSSVVEWRVGTGHHVKYYDTITNTSLVTRVCGNYGAEIVSMQQLNSFKDIDTYLGSGHGSLVSWVAVLVWTLNVACELREVWEQLGAVLAIRGAESVQIYKGDASYSLQSLSTSRTVIVVLVMILRLGVSCGLWYAGMLWLTYSVGISDIINNAVAMSFVFSFDELFYALVPRDLDKLLQNLEPLRLPMWRRSLRSLGQRWIRGADVRSLTLLIVCIVTMFIWTATAGSDFHSELETIRHLFCGGNTNFIYEEDPATLVVKTAVTQTEDELANLDIANTKRQLYDAILQRTDLESGATELESTAGLFTSLQGVTDPLFESQLVSEVERLMVLGVSEAIDQLPCKDMDGTSSARNGMRSSNLAHDSCAQLVEEVGCSGPEVRSFCPEACKCNVSETQIFDRYGCTSQCDYAYEQDLRTKKLEILAGKLLDDGDRCLERPDLLSVDFFKELQRHLIGRGDLRAVDGGVSARFSDNFLQSFPLRTRWVWGVHDVEVDIAGWWNRTRNCWLPLYLDALFLTNLCEGDTDGRKGSLGPFCPRTCGWCDTPKPDVPMQVMASHLNELVGSFLLDPLLAPLRFGGLNSTNLDLEGKVCPRDGGPALEYFAGTTEGAAATFVPRRYAPAQIFNFTAQHTGAYTFRVNGSGEGNDKYDTLLYLWSGTTMRQLQSSDDVVGFDPCFTVDIKGGDHVILVVESWGYRTRGNFTLITECPWSNTDAICRNSAPDMTPKYSRQEAGCGSLGLSNLPGELCDPALELLPSFDRNHGPSFRTVTGASYAPEGCSFDTAARILYVNGTGQGGTQCSRDHLCLCQLEDDQTFNKLPTACNKTIEGPCKACVEELDSYCHGNGWDQGCTTLCSLTCEPVCAAPPVSVTGPCSVTHTTLLADEVEEWCLVSDGFEGVNSSYATNVNCAFALGLKEHGFKSYGPFRVDYFYVGDDSLLVNGKAYSSSSGPEDVTPTGPISWRSGDSPSETLDRLLKVRSGFGWKLCTNVTKAACRDSQQVGAVDQEGRNCSDLARSTWRCTEEADTNDFHVMSDCCHCGGGIREP